MVSRAILNGWPLVPPCKALSAPSFTVQPSISGAPTVGSTLTATLGTVSGFPTPVASYQWLRNGFVIASGPSYVQTANDLGSRIDLLVTLTNVAGTATATITGSTVVTSSFVAFLDSLGQRLLDSNSNSINYKVA